MTQAVANNAALYIYHPNVVEKTDAATETPCGIAIGTVTAAYYGFIQKSGFCPAVLVTTNSTDAIVVNDPLVPSTTAGTMVGATDAGNSAQEAVSGSVVAKSASAINITAGYVAANIYRLM